jgi:GNAT superfamily N-acetyltransferase
LFGDSVTSKTVFDRSEALLIREARPADAGAVSSLLKSAFSEFEPLYTPEAFGATVLSESGVLARLGQGPMWVAEKGSTLIGTVAAVQTEDSVMVRGMAVAPMARGLGIGRALLSLGEDFAKKTGCKRLTLYTTAFLKQAIHLYQAAGFRFTGETANPHGTELLLMAKVID